MVAGGSPFLEFPCYSFLDLQRTTGAGGDGELAGNLGKNGPLNGFSEWFTWRLHTGQPFCDPGLRQTTTMGWEDYFQSTAYIRSNIPIRNCSTARDVNYMLKKFIDAARRPYREFKNLYTRDLHCPKVLLENIALFSVLGRTLNLKANTMPSWLVGVPAHM
ncbi:predicted protein [Histoplasma capsulatum H143]|uniref:Uncharacterized protein n=1 Tax=Ajellomyces capsulatus (strain H143) TaxID=544712 RepID=C6H8I7_AJECH|nr:predicted protein [Histoplasma capsulatum H143]